MKRLNLHHTFIFHILLLSCIISMFGTGLTEHALFGAGRENSARISSQSFTTSDNITTIHVSEGNLTLAIIRGIKNSSRQKSFGRNSMLLFLILTILSGVFRLTQNILSFYHRLYVWHRYCLITYIHAKDGRKRQGLC